MPLARTALARSTLALLGALGLSAACGNDHTPPSSAPDLGGEGGAIPDPSGGAFEGGSPPGEGGLGGGSGSSGAGDGSAGEQLGGAGGQDSNDDHAALRRSAYPPSPYPVENPDSEAKALLGKILFWDEQLGGDNTVACGTCHRPKAGGSDPRSSTAAAALPGLDAVLGTNDDIHGSLGLVRCSAQGMPIGSWVQVTTRKAPTYLDAMFAGRLFWDGRTQCNGTGCPSFSAFEDPDNPGIFPIASGGALESQAVGPPLSPVEMACEDATWSAIHAKLEVATPLGLAKQVPPALAQFISEHNGSYPDLFAAAFGADQTSGPEDEINTRRIAFAIATHERRLRSDQTPWDRWNAGDPAALSPAQLRGLDVFMNQGACEGCHRAPTFSDGDFHYIGFHRPAEDLGRNAIDPDFGKPGAMRTPTLRNVGLREAGGLLRNGAGPGASLAAVIELYDLGGLTEDPEVAAVPIDAAILPLALSKEQKADLLDFLRHGLTDPRVAAELPPFDRPLLSTE